MLLFLHCMVMTAMLTCVILRWNHRLLPSHYVKFSLELVFSRCLFKEMASILYQAVWEFFTVWSYLFSYVSVINLIALYSLVVTVNNKLACKIGYLLASKYLFVLLLTTRYIRSSSSYAEHM